MNKLFGFVAFITITSYHSLLAQAPTITSFQPTNGPIGTSVTIIGTGFNSTPDSNIVFFGAAGGTVTAATSTSLTVTVPTSSTYDYITVTNLGDALTAYSAKPFIVTFAGHINFAPKVDIITGLNPRYVSIGDINGNGKLDLVVADDGSDSVTVLVNSSIAGAISFATTLDTFAGMIQTGSLSTSQDPRSVVLGDLAGNGKLDLVVATAQGSEINVFPNLYVPNYPDPFFSLNELNFNYGPAYFFLSLGDLDGDGKVDIAADDVSDHLYILHNTTSNGIINFTVAGSFVTGDNARYVCISDIDGDGKPDVVVPNWGDGTVSVFRNITSGGILNFADTVNFPTGSGPFCVKIGDIDGDGKPDLVVTNSTGNSVSVFRNTSVPGQISFANMVTFTTGNYPVSVSIGDIDGDSKPDLAVTNFDNSTVSVLQNTSVPGTINFAAKIDFTTGTNPNSVCIGDIDGDGKPDLIIANYGTNTVSILRQIDQPLGIINSTIMKLVIYPNPTENIIKIVADNFQTPVDIELIDDLGRLVSHKEVSAGIINDELNMSNYSSGLYLLVIKDKEGILETRRVVKN